MNPLTLRIAASLLPLLAVAAAPPVTPMTLDVVASYNSVLPEADYIKRTAMVPTLPFDSGTFFTSQSMVS
jgi:hypothetical protein